eukprot:2779953-Pleurochrysis_carterae.AAC.1
MATTHYCNFHPLANCCAEGAFKPDKGLRDCLRCGAAGKYHHFCAALEKYEEETEVVGSTLTLCAVCAKL